MNDSREYLHLEYSLNNTVILQVITPTKVPLFASRVSKEFCLDNWT